MKEEICKLADQPRYRSNPFSEEFIMYKLNEGSHRKGMRYARQDGMVVSPEGEVLQRGELVLGKQYHVDRDQFIKIYTKTFMLFHGLTKKAAQLFANICERLEKNSDIIYIVPAQIYREMEISEPTFYRALNELVNAKIIARSTDSSVIYYINPTYVFNGDRMTLVHRFVSSDEGEDTVSDDALQEEFNKYKSLEE